MVIPSKFMVISSVLTLSAFISLKPSESRGRAKGSEIPSEGGEEFSLI